MRIFTKKAFKFQDRANGKHVSTKHLQFADVPDWVERDLIFQWGVADGDIEIINSRKAEHNMELKNPKRANNNGKNN